MVLQSASLTGFISPSTSCTVYDVAPRMKSQQIVSDVAPYSSSFTFFGVLDLLAPDISTPSSLQAVSETAADSEKRANRIYKMLFFMIVVRF